MSTKIIRVVDLFKNYQMGTQVVQALRGVSFHVAKGEYVAIMGQSGSGKSTLMNILGCLDKASAGIYELDNIDVCQIPEGRMAHIRNEKIGFIFQNFNLLPNLNVLENVALPGFYKGMSKAARLQRSADVCKKVGLDQRMEHMPYQLSGGQMQRVAIARALLLNPSILLADEPTGNLDSVTQNEILDLFDALYRNGSTILVVTHELDVAARARRMISFRDGKQSSDIDLDLIKKKMETIDT